MPGLRVTLRFPQQRALPAPKPADTHKLPSPKPRGDVATPETKPAPAGAEAA